MVEGETWAKEILEKLFTCLEKKCRIEGWQRFSQKHVYAILAESRERFGLWDRLTSDLKIMVDVGKHIAQLSNELERTNMKYGLLALVEKAAANSSNLLMLRSPKKDYDEQYRLLLFLKMISYLDDCGIAKGRELSTVAAGILIYTGDVPAEAFGFDARVDVFNLSKKDMDRAKKRLQRRIERSRPEESGDKTPFFSDGLVATLDSGILPKESKPTPLTVWAGRKRLKRGSILPNSGQKRT